MDRRTALAHMKPIAPAGGSANARPLAKIFPSLHGYKSAELTFFFFFCRYKLQ